MPDALKNKYWQPLTGKHRPAAWEVLDGHYREPHRAYHTWGHIGDLLKKLDGHRHLATRSDLIAVAIFWHDVIYQTQNPDGSRRLDAVNVRESADLFRRYALLPENDADAVHAMIMATANHLHAVPDREYYPGFTGDFELLLDLDLSPLAASWRKAARDTRRIRREYFFVPEPVFRAKRAEILQTFHDATPLFRRSELEEKWGNVARRNLARSIRELNP